MVPVTFMPKFRPDTISQFLEEKDEMARLDALMSPVPPAPLWADPMQRGPVTRQEWMSHQDPVTGQNSNWQAYASDFLGKAGLDPREYKIGQTQEDGIAGPGGRRHSIEGGEQGRQPFKPAMRSGLVALSGMGKMPASRRKPGAGGAGSQQRSYRRGAYAGYSSFTGGR